MTSLTKLFTNTEVSPTVLHVVVLRHFSTDAYQWEPQTLWKEIEDTFKVSLPRTNKDKIQAVFSLVATNLFYVQWEVFEKICKSFNNVEISFRHVSPLITEEMIVALIEASLNDVDFETAKWDPEVKIYVQSVLKKDGFLKIPEILKFSEYPEFSVSQELEEDQRLKILRLETLRIRRLEEVNHQFKHYL